MQRLVFLNSKYVNFKDAKIHIEDRGLQFSDSIYEVIPFYGKKLNVAYLPAGFNPSHYDLPLNVNVRFWPLSQVLFTK